MVTRTLLFLPLVGARIFSGTISDSFAAIGRFAWAPGGGSATLTTGGQTLYLGEFSETVWNGVTNRQCNNPISDLIPPTSIQPGTHDIPVPAPNAMVFFSLQTVPFPSPQNPPSPCQPASSPSTYTLVLKQGSGSQLSYEEQGLPAIYAVFWIFMGATLALHIYGHMVGPKPSNYPKVRPRLVDALAALLALHAVSNTLHLIEWGVVDQTGKDSGMFLAAVGGLFRLAALCALWVMAAFIATGYGISTMNIGSMRDAKNYRGAILLSVLVVLGFTTTLLYSLTPRSVASARGSSAQGGMAITLTLFILGYLVWFVKRVRETIAAEVSVTKKALLNALMWVTLGSFFILPFAEILCECGEERWWWWRRLGGWVDGWGGGVPLRA